MKKRLSKRRVWARFMQGKLVSHYDMIRCGLVKRTFGIDVDVDEINNAVRRTARKVLEEKE